MQYTVILTAGNSRGAEYILKKRIKSAHVVEQNNHDLPPGQIRLRFVNLMDEVSETGISVTHKLLAAWARESIHNGGILIGIGGR